MASLNRERAIARIEKRIIPVSEATPYVKVLLYGRNGKGKTRIAATAPKPLIIDVNEQGTSSVRNYPDAHVLNCSRWEDITYAYWYLRSGNHPFESAIIDTLTQAQKICMKHVLNEAEDRDPNRPASMPDRRAWGQMTELMKPIIFDFRNLPMHIVFVCQERVDRASDDEEESGEVQPRVVPDLSPSVRGDAMAAVGIMGRVYRRGVRIGKGRKERVEWETRMLVGDHEQYESKDRTGKLGYVIRKPSIPQMIEALNDSSNSEEE